MQMNKKACRLQVTA
uniref:Uncharacterized protein n=1 Tax=Lepeophtheirus salmonis TaxID=72036 RepID=A0A0K2V8Z2_LEPSM